MHNLWHIGSCHLFQARKEMLKQYFCKAFTLRGVPVIRCCGCTTSVPLLKALVIMDAVDQILRCDGFMIFINDDRTCNRQSILDKPGGNRYCALYRYSLPLCIVDLLGVARCGGKDRKSTR